MKPAKLTPAEIKLCLEAARDHSAPVVVTHGSIVEGCNGLTYVESVTDDHVNLTDPKGVRRVGVRLSQIDEVQQYPKPVPRVGTREERPQDG